MSKAADTFIEFSPLSKGNTFVEFFPLTSNVECHLCKLTAATRNVTVIKVCEFTHLFETILDHKPLCDKCMDNINLKCGNYWLLGLNMTIDPDYVAVKTSSKKTLNI